MFKRVCTWRKRAGRLADWFHWIALAFVSLNSMAAPATGPSGAAAFTDVTAKAGLTHRHYKPTLDHQLDNIMSWVCSVGAAGAAADFNHDGWLDLYVTNSRQGEPNFLYKNNGDGSFTDVAKQAGVAEVNTTEKGASMDCVWGDYDNDGWPDLYLVRWGTDSLYRNNGDGTFTEVTAKLFKRRDGSPGIDWANGCAAIFWDYNLDGRLDIYVGNYFDEHDLWHLKTTRIMHDDFEKARNAGRNFLYRQNADGTFTQVAHELGLDDPGWTLSVGSADVNNDGWPDLYIADDFGPDQLFLNNKQGGFTNVTATAIGFDTKKGMNVDFGDIDGDGWLDIYVANITTAEYLQEGNMLWHNNGPGPDGNITFTDIALETGTYDGGWGWGAKFFDYDHDGDLDIIAVNGFISAGKGNYWYDLASWTVKGQDVADAKNWPTIGDRSFSGHEKDRFWQNDGNYAFRECAANLGLASERDGRGVVCFDYDNDGDLDLFIANHDQPPNLYRNNLIQAAAGKTLTPALSLSEKERENVSLPPDKPARAEKTNQPPAVPPRPRRGGEGRGEGVAGSTHWLMLSLVANPATKINRDCLGTRVTAITSTGRLIREHNGGKCYCGQSDPRVHFGLGKEDRVRLLEVRWPDGGLQYVENVRADQLLTIRQDPAQYATQLALTAPPPKPWQRPKEQQEKVVHKLSPEELDKMLSEMEKRLRESLDSYQLASAYRARCADHDQHDRAIKFFESIVAKDPASQRARMELACAFVDKIPTCGGMAAIVSKGTLARKSLDQMDAYLAKEADSWLGLYTRGMNHLHWPRALLHSDDAAADLTRCAELQEKDAKPKPYYLRTYIALGDAYTKAKQYDKAREAWRRGRKHFANAKELKDRLAIKEDSALFKYVETQRSLEKPIDTDLSFMDRGRL